MESRAAPLLPFFFQTEPGGGCANHGPHLKEKVLYVFHSEHNILSLKVLFNIDHYFLILQILLRIKQMTHKIRHIIFTIISLTEENKSNV